MVNEILGRLKLDSSTTYYTPTTTTTTPTTKPKLSAGDLAILGSGIAVIGGIVAYGVSKRKK